jgi:hypothetical protein
MIDNVVGVVGSNSSVEVEVEMAVRQLESWRVGETKNTVFDEWTCRSANVLVGVQSTA